MEREEALKFANSLILLSKLLTKIEDRFFVQKLHEKLLDLIFAFSERRTAPLSMSHNVAAQNLLNSINNLLDYLEYLAHISKNNTTPLLSAQRNLLKFKLYILRHNHQKKPTAERVVETVNPVFAPKTRTVQQIPKSDSNKEKIFHFIKKYPDTRTRDIVSEFSALSGRTVKRNLKELTDEGFLQKRTDSGAVYYTCG